MKYLIFAMFSLLPVLGMAQNKPTPEDSIRIDDLFKDLTESWSLGIIDESSNPDIWLFNKFKSLFDSTATIDDEFNAHFTHGASGELTYDYRISRGKGYDEYAHNIILEMAKLAIDTPGERKLLSRTGDQYVYLLPRRVTASKMRRFVLDQPARQYFDTLAASRHFSFDSIRSAFISRNKLYNDSEAIYTFECTNDLYVTIQKFDQEFKIMSIRLPQGAPMTIKCSNDADGDGILDTEDRDSNEPGDFTAYGKKDFDFDMVSDDLDKCDRTYGEVWNAGCPWYYFNNRVGINGPNFGIRFNSLKPGLPEPDEAGYSSVDMNMSKKGKLATSGLVWSFMFGADASYYFTPSKKHGISFGWYYTSFKHTLTLAGDAVYTYKANDGTATSPGNDYRRRVTLRSGSKEDIQFNVMNFPLLYRIRGRFAKSKEKKDTRFFEITAGPSVLLFRNVSDYDVHADFEGLYQVDPSSSQLTYSNYFDESSTWNIILTGDEIDHQSGNPGVDALYAQLNKNGYDFAQNQSFKGKDKSAMGMNFAFNANVDYSAQFGNTILKVGLGLMWSGRKNYLNDYKPLNNTRDQYFSLLRHERPFSYIAYGINLGVTYGF